MNRFALGLAMTILTVGTTIADEPQPRWVLKGHKAIVDDVAFSPNGVVLVSGSDDRSVRVWDVGTGRELARLDEQHGVTSLSFSPDGKNLAVTCSTVPRRGRAHGALTLWDMSRFEKRVILTDPNFAHTIGAVAYSPDGKTVVAQSFGRIIVWDTVKSQPRISFDAAGSAPELAFSRDGETLAAVGWAIHDVRLWDPATGALKTRLRGHTRGLYAVEFSPDGRTLASGGTDDTVRVWYVATGQVLKTFKGFRGGVMALSYTTDGHTLAVGCVDGTVALLDMVSFEERAKFRGHPGVLTSMDFSPDGKLLATAGNSPIVRVWNVADLLASSAPAKNGTPGGTTGVKAPGKRGKGE